MAAKITEEERLEIRAKREALMLQIIPVSEKLALLESELAKLEARCPHLRTHVGEEITPTVRRIICDDCGKDRW